MMVITILSLALTSIILGVNGQRYYLQGIIYQGLVSEPCFRVLDQNGSYGCQSLSGATGILWQVSTSSELQQFVDSAPAAKYAIVMPFSLLNMDHVNKLQTSGKLGGILLVKDGFGYTMPDTYSPDSSCPGCNYGLYGNVPTNDQPKWNINGNNVLLQNWDFPIFGFSPIDNGHRQAINILREAIAFNSQRGYSGFPLYAIEFDAFMWAAINSETCLRRGWCLPIGGLSVWSTFSSGLTRESDKPIVVISAKTDSRSLIPNYAYGASGRTGIIGVLAVAEALSRAPTPISSLPKHVIFTLFNAESWGYAGSQRFVKDISTPFSCKENNNDGTSSCPIKSAACTRPCFFRTDFTKINFDRIESIIELDTIGGLYNPNPTNAYIHVDSITPGTTNLISALTAATQAGVSGGPNVTITFQPARSLNSSARDMKLPPSSSMSFLAQKNSISAAVISDYSTEFSNKFYHSEYDDGQTWDSKQTDFLCGVATQTARAVFNLLNGTTGSSSSALQISANCTFISVLMDCFTRNASCSYLIPILNGEGLKVQTNYPGVFRWDRPDWWTYIYHALLSNITASERKASGSCKEESDCDDANGFSCVAKTCVKSLTRYHHAYGTGIEMDYNSGTFQVTNSSKPGYTESTWGATQIRVFKTASRTYEVIQLSVGLIITVGAAALVKLSNLYLESFLSRR